MTYLDIFIRNLFTFDDDDKLILCSWHATAPYFCIVQLLQICATVGTHSARQRYIFEYLNASQLILYNPQYYAMRPELK